jgi:glutamine amidotransferase
MIAIIDYQMGNLRSVQKGFERVGHEAVVTSDPAVLADAEKIVLPGVGAFEDAMAELQRRELVEPIKAAIDDDRPFLGICLGLQLLFDTSYEHGEHAGLGVVAGEVVEFDVPKPLKVPHMGWNALEFQQTSPLLHGLDEGVYCYFVHSYYVVPKDASVTVAVASYERPFCAVIQRGSLFATQFHPEKSQTNGLRILQNFAELAT